MTSVPIDIALVRRLVAAQFPEWAGLPVRPVEPGGGDDRTFHLGDRMTIRLPGGAGHAAQADKEHRWLPVLAPRLPLLVPVPLAKGAPGEDYPFSWSVHRWIDGGTASRERVGDLAGFAEDLADFLGALQDVDPAGGPPPGAHSAFRGAPLATYDAETRRAIAGLDGRIAGDAALAVWETALAAAWHGTPVWFHGDVAAGNLLVRNGRLAAVVGFGRAGIGDPACDTAIAWTLLSGESRRVFHDTLEADPATWARGRGWALWTALITLAGATGNGTDRAGADRVEAAGRVLAEVLADHREEA